MGNFVVLYFDNVLIYNSCMDQHLHHLREVLFALRREQLYANLLKCELLTISLNFLGFIISAKGLELDPNEVAAITNWPLVVSMVLLLFIGDSFGILASYGPPLLTA